MITLLIVLWLGFAGFIYTECVKTALPVKRWVFAALVFGPMLWPLFSIEVRMRLVRARGYEYLLIRA